MDCDQKEVEELEISDDVVLWSDPDSWDSGAVPVEGDEVEIPPGVNMAFDIEESPLLKSLTINGRLTFLNDPETPADRTLHSYWVYIRQGELIIGTEEEPYNGEAEIKLYGAVDEETLAFSMLVEGGNKVLAIVGTAKLYGQPRNQMSRLKETVYTSDTEILVDVGLDWTGGDRIALMPTTIHPMHVDYRTIDTYDPLTGIVTLTEALDYYHWGKSYSTGSAYEGVDMRCEVVLLTRNVRIVGDDTDSWGGQVMVTDNLEASGVQREGQLLMDNVEVYNCSQRNTHRSAIRFEMVELKWQSITNSVVHGSIA